MTNYEYVNSYNIAAKDGTYWATHEFTGLPLENHKEWVTVWYYSYAEDAWMTDGFWHQIGSPLTGGQDTNYDGGVDPDQSSSILIPGENYPVSDKVPVSFDLDIPLPASGVLRLSRDSETRVDAWSAETGGINHFQSGEIKSWDLSDSFERNDALSFLAGPIWISPNTFSYSLNDGYLRLTLTPLVGTSILQDIPLTSSALTGRGRWEGLRTMLDNNWSEIPQWVKDALCGEDLYVATVRRWEYEKYNPDDSNVRRSIIRPGGAFGGKVIKFVHEIWSKEDRQWLDLIYYDFEWMLLGTLVHETRHRLDKANGITDKYILEFRAYQEYYYFLLDNPIVGGKYPEALKERFGNDVTEVFDPIKFDTYYENRYCSDAYDPSKIIDDESELFDDPYWAKIGELLINCP